MLFILHSQEYFIILITCW